MRSKQTLLYFCVVFAITNGAHIQPLDLVDEALAQVEQLKSLVQGEILAAHNTLNDIILAFHTNSVSVANTGVLSIEQEQDKIVTQLASLKHLADLEGKNSSQCFERSDENLDDLSQRLIREMTDCIAHVGDEAKRLTESSKYTVDVSYNVASHFEFQIRQCGGNLLCIAPILNEVELNKIKLPQNIKTEIEGCESLLIILQVYTQSCSKNKISQYVTEGILLFMDIESCINSLPAF